MSDGTIPGTTVVIDNNDPDFNTEVWNSTDVDTSQVYAAMSSQNRSLVAALGNWAGRASGQRRRGSLWDRDRFVTPDNVYDQMRLAYDAVENDDVVAGVLETTESLAFGKMSFYAEDPDEQDIYNQIAANLDLDSRMREMWRELFTVSQFYAAIWWERKEFKVRGKGRKKTFNLRVPTGMTILDPLKIVPVGMTMFNKERLCWIMDRNEAAAFEDPSRRAADPIMQRLLLGKYTPSDGERRWMSDLQIPSDNLYEINPANVFRHTATRPQYQRFATVRMKSVFPLLDQKEQLRAMDRAHLIGGTNFIVLITQGSDQNPAKPEEIAHLQASVRVVAQTPVLVGDHRLDVKIVTPKQDATLSHDKYDTVDIRISSRLFQMFIRTTSGDRADKGSDLLKVVAAGMESRRKMLRRALEKNVLSQIWETNDTLLTPPKLEFSPKQIALDFNAAQATFMLSLREAREISRHTILNQFELSQEFEAEMLEREKEMYDDTFQTINPNNQGQPGDPAAPKAPEDPKKAGRQKGGAAPGTNQGQEPVKKAGIKKAAAPKKAAAQRLREMAQEMDDDDQG